MKRLAPLILALILSSGCALFNKAGGVATPLPGEVEAKRLVSAVAHLRQGDSGAAVKELEAVCAAAPVPGITDEALFRLALLTLKPSLERPASLQAHQLLKRLNKEYPQSPWNAQAQPLAALVKAAEDLRRQNRTYKSANQTLTNELRELNSTIERLKSLDLEFEKKTR